MFGPHTHVLGLYYDNPEITDADKLRSDAAVTVHEGIQGEGDVQIGEIAGGDYAIAVVRRLGRVLPLVLRGVAASERTRTRRCAVL